LIFAKTKKMPSRLDTLEETMARLSKAKVVAILRAKNAAVALARADELVAMGCKCIEVTTDSVDFEKLLTALVKRIGDQCVIGVGTITTREQLEVSARCGAKFALSPVNPDDWGFIESCHKMGVVSVPAAFSPQEIYTAARQGAMCIKVFPAQLWSPSKFKSLRGVGDFGNMRLIPSGGITPENAQEWMAAGAFAVGMGSGLTGKDVKTPPNATEALKESQADWEARGKVQAAKLFQSMGLQVSRSRL